MTVDVAVIGAGLIGVYTAWRLADAGAAVVVLEQGIAGDGSTGRSAGGLRSQFASSYEIALSRASRTFYHEFDRDPDFPGGIDRTGYLFLASPAQLPLLEQVYRTQRSHGVDVEWLEPDELAGVVPYCDLAHVEAGTYTRDDGFIDPWAVHQWLLHHARAAGVEVLQHTPAQSLRRSGAGWLVNTLSARQLVLAAGAWTGEVASRAGIDLPITPSPRVKVLTDRHPQLPRDMPLVTDLETGAYVRSEHGHALVGAKPRRTPVGFEFDTGMGHLAEIIERAAAVFPTLAVAGIVRAVCGLYELTPDNLPLAGPIRTHPGLWVIAGFNGHGIMHGPAVAEAVTACMSERAPSIDIEPLRPDRFGTAAELPRRPSLL
ncbi:MAG TPA: FAD-binding oxidoreductase [Jatrophihabitantaceae bacterium]|jgi:sarcosine oxidase subunit beta